MAILEINIPDDKVADLAAAIESAWGREEGEGNAAMAKRHILNRLQKVYTWYKGQQAKAQAEIDAADDINIT